jgi:SMP-30/Gluconolactonase/LRE-like region
MKTLWHFGVMTISLVGAVLSIGSPPGALVASCIRFANGIGVSPNGSTLYVAESSTAKVLAFPIRGDGSLGPVRDLIRLRDVLPASVSLVRHARFAADRRARQRFRRPV